MKYAGVGSVGERHQLRRGVRVAGVDRHVRRASVWVVNGLDQRPSGASVELEQCRLDGFGREARKQVFAAVMSVAVENNSAQRLRPRHLTIHKRSYDNIKTHLKTTF